MSEEKDVPSSSGIPEGRRPTAIRPTEPLVTSGVKPTVMPGSTPAAPPVSAPKPTAMVPSGTPHAPTVLSGDTQVPFQVERQPSRITPPSTPPPTPSLPPAITQPSAIVGTVRKRIQTSVEDIVQKFPGVSREHAERVERIIERHVVEVLTETDCARWGEATQQKFSQLTERSLALTSHGVVIDSGRHLTRLYSLLEELGENFRNGNASKGITLPWGKKPSTLKEVFSTSRRELEQLKIELEGALPNVIDTNVKLQVLVAEAETLEDDLDAEYLGAQYLADVVLDKTTHAQHIAQLLSRSGSLLQTIAYLKQGRLMREQSSEHLRQLTARIQDGVMNALPVWIESVTIAFQQSTNTDTEVYSLRQKLQGLIQQLK